MPAMTYAELLTRIIDDGITACKESYKDRPHDLAGAIAGFEACRGKEPVDLAVLHELAASQYESVVREFVRPDPNLIRTGWRFYARAFRAEIEWVCNVVSVAMRMIEQPPVLPWQPTVRAGMKYAQIVGVTPLIEEDKPE